MPGAPVQPLRWQVFNADQVKMLEELCILVDDDDNVVGPDTKKNVHLMDGPSMRPGGIPHRAFSVFLFNQQNGTRPPRTRAAMRQPDRFRRP